MGVNGHVSEALWSEVARLTELSRVGLDVIRDRERVQRTAEIFTPTELVVDLLRKVPIESFGPGKKVLDPACGDGQFLAAVKFAKILIWGQSEQESLGDLFGIDLLKENVRLCRQRLGGGTIVVGDSLNPERIVPGQSDRDRQVLNELIEDSHLSLF
jgi:SAM-dependent methyltransferase